MIKPNYLGRVTFRMKVVNDSEVIITRNVLNSDDVEATIISFPKVSSATDIVKESVAEGTGNIISDAKLSDDDSKEVK